MSVVGAIDLGTTSVRFMLFSHDGRVVGMAQEELETIRPQPGWAEQDPEAVWAATERCINQACAAHPDSTVTAVGITNQRESTLVWSRSSGRPLHNAVLWHDTRTQAVVDALGDQEQFRAQTGLPVATYFSAPKLLWLFDNVEGLRAAAEAGDVAFGTFDSWLVWKLTEGASHVTDVTNASRTMLMDLRSLAWDDALFPELPRSILPRIVPSSTAAGIGACARPAALAGVPIGALLGDQQAALFGQACFRPGEAKSTFGTGCFLLCNTGEAPVHSSAGLLTTVAYQLEGAPAVYALEGSVAVGGQLIQWLRDSLQLIGSAAEVEERARAVEDSGGLYFVPAFAGLFAPYWRPDARGVMCGMTSYVTRDHVCRAALEAVAFQIAEVAQAMEGVELQQLKVDGGMVVNELLMQFQADMLGVDVVRPSVAETTALGAAYAAGLAVGFWQSTAEVTENWQELRRWSAAMPEEERAAKMAKWKKAVERTLNWEE